MHKKIFILSILFIILSGLIVYSNSFTNDFVWDDNFFIVKNELIRDIGNWQEIITQELWHKPRANYYRPTQVFSYMLDYHIYGLEPFGYHLTNFILHILNAILTYIIVLNLILQAPRSTFAYTEQAAHNIQTRFIPLITALLFVVHPIHTESVSYISGRADLLVGFFMLSALILYIRQPAAVRFKKTLYLCSLFLFSLALFSKEMSVIFPVILIGYEYFFKKAKREKLISRINRIAPFFLMAVFYIIARMTIFHFSSKYFWLESSVVAPLSSIRVFSFLKGIVLYLGLLAVPVNLHLEHYIIPAKGIFDPYVLTAALMLLVLLIIFKRVYFNHKQLILFGIIWFLIFLFPQSNFFFTLILSAHFLYIPSIGIFFALACLLDNLYLKKKYFTRAIFITITVFWGILTFSHNYIWRDSLTLYRWIDKSSSLSYLARNNLANIYAYLGLDDLAIEKYEQALKINPETETAKQNLSVVEDSLIQKYRDILKSEPYSAIYYYNLAYIYERKGKFNEAISYYKKATELKPEFVEAIGNLGNVYAKTGDYEQALIQFRQAISVDPQFAKGYFNIGVILVNQDKLEEAKGWFEQALKVDPDYQKAKQGLIRLNQMLKSR